MARIAGVDLPKNKRMEIALTYIYGIGRSKSKEILQKAGVGADTKTDHLADAEITAIRNVIDRDHKVEGDLRREISMSSETADGYRHLSGVEAPKGSSRERAANQHQRPDAKRTPAVHRGKEEDKSQ